MKLSLSGLSKKHYITSGVIIVALAAGGVTAALNSPQKTGADTSPLTTEVDRQGQELSNHEARITNAENDIKDLQNNTGTAPNSNRVDVPAASTTQTVVSTPAAPTQTVSPTQSAASPAPVIVTSVGTSINLNGDTHCILYYSDGSQGTAPLDSQNDCQSYIGQAKS